MCYDDCNSMGWYVLITRHFPDQQLKYSSGQHGFSGRKELWMKKQIVKFMYRCY
jgi:hypothetical protein